ncbi:MAG: hypothetical protein IPK15_20080 [Verrucomicrobia bacterium]|nr:hypothetical protein [Verrucomicrobiota bacterium]
MQVMFDAHVTPLINVRRARVSKDDEISTATSDYLSLKVQTNALTGTVNSPYEVTFGCLSSELAAVLEGLASSKHGFIVKAINVEPAVETLTNAPPGFTGMPGNQPIRGNPPRQALGGRPQPGGGNPSAANRPIILLNERRLKVTLSSTPLRRSSNAMEQVKKIGQLCRQHYEKMVLVIVLLLLAGAVWVLYGKSQEENDKVREMTEGYTKKSGKPIPPVSLQPFESAMKSATNRPSLSYAGQHNLFNPVKWQQNRGGGSVIKVQSGTEVGVGAMRIVSVTPLLLSISFEKTATSGTEVTGYHTMVTNEMATLPRLRRIAQYVAMDAGKNPMLATNTQVFVMTDFKGLLMPNGIRRRFEDFDNEASQLLPR